MELPFSAQLQQILNDGYKVYLVGGAVRDLLLGLSPSDYDFITNAPKEYLRKLLKDSKVKNTRLVAYKLSQPIDGVDYELTKMRIDKKYINGKLIDFEFTDDINEDLSRRDFTVNAIAVEVLFKNELTINLEKLYCQNEAKNDLSTKTLRGVKDPHLLFMEDPSRIHRAKKLIETLGFTPDKKLAEELQSSN